MPRKDQRRTLPPQANIGKEVMRCWAAFIDWAITTVSVYPDGRGRDKQLGRQFALGQRLAQKPGVPAAALKNLLLLPFGPCFFADVLPCQVDHYIKSFQVFYL
jgi:hypothetical protein